jgi:hypothetical protein
MLWVDGQISSCGSRENQTVMRRAGAVRTNFLPVKIYDGNSSEINEYRRKRAVTYVDGDEVDLRVTVLAGLGGRHFHNLARAPCIRA